MLHTHPTSTSTSTSPATGHLGKDAKNKSDSTLTDANPASYIISPRSNSQSVSPLNTTPSSPHNRSESVICRDKSISGELLNDRDTLMNFKSESTNKYTRDDSINNDIEDGDSDSMIFERNVEDPYFLNNFARGSHSNSTRTSRAASIYRVPTSVSIQSDVSNATSTMMPLERHTTLENYVPPILDEMGSLVTDNDTNLEDISMIYNPRRPSSTLGLDMALGRRTSSYSNGDPQPYSPQALSISGSNSNNNNNNNSNKLLRLHSYADILYNDNPRPNLKPHHASYSEASSPSLLLSHQNSHSHQNALQQHSSSHQNSMFIQPGSTVNAIQETNIKNPFMLRHSETSTSYLTSSKNNHLFQYNSHQSSKNHPNNNNKFHIESSEEGSNDDENTKSE